MEETEANLREEGALESADHLALVMEKAKETVA